MTLQFFRKINKLKYSLSTAVTNCMVLHIKSRNLPPGATLINVKCNEFFHSLHVSSSSSSSQHRFFLFFFVHFVFFFHCAVYSHRACIKRGSLHIHKSENIHLIDPFYFHSHYRFYFIILKMRIASELLCSMFMFMFMFTFICIFRLNWWFCFTSHHSKPFTACTVLYFYYSLLQPLAEQNRTVKAPPSPNSGRSVCVSVIHFRFWVPRYLTKHFNAACEHFHL